MVNGGVEVWSSMLDGAAARSLLRFAQICAICRHDGQRIREEDQEARLEARYRRIVRPGTWQRQSRTTVLRKPVHDAQGSQERNRSRPAQRDARSGGLTRADLED